MNLSTQHCEMIEKMAAIFMKISDMAAILGLDADQLRDEIKRDGSQANLAYQKGKVTTVVEIHKQEMMLARLGSPTAIENMRNNLLDMEEDE